MSHFSLLNVSVKTFNVTTRSAREGWKEGNIFSQFSPCGCCVLVTFHILTANAHYWCLRRALDTGITTCSLLTYFISWWLISNLQISSWNIINFNVLSNAIKNLLLLNTTLNNLSAKMCMKIKFFNKSKILNCNRTVVELLGLQR